MMALTSPQTTYPSDLTDHEWRRIEPLLPEEKPKGRHRATNLRVVVSAIRYREHFGCPWRMLPDDFPAWGTVYSYYRRWNRAGLWAEIQAALSDARKEDGEIGRGRESMRIGHFKHRSTAQVFLSQSPLLPISPSLFPCRDFPGPFLFGPQAGDRIIFPFFSVPRQDPNSTESRCHSLR